MRISDWSSDVCSSDLQERHPGIEPAPARQEPPKQLELPDLDRDDADAASDKRAMDRVRTALVRADAMNQGRDRDLLPGMCAMKVRQNLYIDQRLSAALERSEERRVGKEWVSTCRSRW